MKAMERARDRIRRQLEAGAAVEHGPHSASLIARMRRSYRVKGGRYFELIVR